MIKMNRMLVMLISIITISASAQLSAADSIRRFFGYSTADDSDSRSVSVGDIFYGEGVYMFVTGEESNKKVTKFRFLDRFKRDDEDEWSETFKYDTDIPLDRINNDERLSGKEYSEALEKMENIKCHAELTKILMEAPSNSRLICDWCVNSSSHDRHYNWNTGVFRRVFLRGKYFFQYKSVPSYITVPRGSNGRISKLVLDYCYQNEDQIRKNMPKVGLYPMVWPDEEQEIWNEVRIRTSVPFVFAWGEAQKNAASPLRIIPLDIIRSRILRYLMHTPLVDIDIPKDSEGRPLCIGYRQVWGGGSKECS